MPTVEVNKLLEGLTFSNEEERKAAEALFGRPENLEVASRRYLRRDEGTRLAQETAAAKAAADAAKAEADKRYQEGEAYFNSLSTWEQEEKTRLTAERTALEAERGRYRQVLISQGIDPNSAFGQQMIADNATALAVTTAAGTAIDTAALDKKYLGMDMARAIAQQAIELPLQMPAIMARYAILYGDIKGANWQEFQEQAKTALLTKGIAVADTAESYFKFGDKQKEMETAALRAQIEAEVEEKYREKNSGVRFPGASPHMPEGNKVFESTFSEKSTNSEAIQNDEAYQHFLQTNAELEAKGIHMLQ